jgi:hypothetical protein
VRVDVRLTANGSFAEAQQSFGTSHRFAELDVPTATPEGLVLLKLYAPPSLYRRGLFDRVTVYEGDIASLMQRRRPAVEPLLQRLQNHLETGDLNELRGIVRDIEARIARFEQHKRIEGERPDSTRFGISGRTGPLLLNWQLLQAGFPLTVIQVEERARYLGALDRDPKSGHAGQLLDRQTLVAGAVERSLDLAAG